MAISIFTIILCSALVALLPDEPNEEYMDCREISRSTPERVLVLWDNESQECISVNWDKPIKEYVEKVSDGRMSIVKGVKHNDE